MKTVLITEETLLDFDVCDEGRAKFNEYFPGGLDLNRRAYLIPLNSKGWEFTIKDLGWFADELLDCNEWTDHIMELMGVDEVEDERGCIGWKDAQKIATREQFSIFLAALWEYMT